MVDLHLLNRVLGDELRTARRRQNLTRQDVIRQLRDPLSLSTMGSYECGERQLLVSRLFELCEIIGVAPEDVLARTHERISRSDADANRLLNLKTIAASNLAPLGPVARWAKRVVAAGTTRIPFSSTLSQQMADVCGVERPRLVSMLETVGAFVNVVEVIERD